MNTKTLGAISVVAGTSIGAGMLGLPMTLGNLGFTTGACALVFMWVVAAYSALMLLEINLEFGKGVNFNFMTRKILGHTGQLIGTGSVFFLLYCLIVAYLSGIGGLVSNAIGVEPRLGAAFFTAISIVVLVAGTHIVVQANKYLFILMIAAMFVCFGTLGGQMNLNFLSQGNPTPQALFVTFPVLITSFGYHVCIPSIVNYIGEDKKSLMRILLLGGALPSFCYLLWLFLSLGSTTPEQLASITNVDALVDLISGGTVWVQTVVSVFASLALITSFLGVSLSLFDLVAETFKRKDNCMGRIGTSLIVFLPPLGASMLAPDGFIAALAHAGAAFTVIAVLLPCIMIWKMRAAGLNQKFRVFGGRPAIVASFVCGLAIILANYVHA
ncbi:amino acid permease [Desulfovibrio sp. JC022]|uniref:amino acid permease n=1 Tax=Desulfovibrio sp. JC022 TaxID=2593642 RepID=UPI0013D2DF07|nr:aromatic amino acid transport family protein [Desulfovibrio sp. JC022]NDV23551.1 aromatic amino acid permease [Desulfovibrio sp. JC022]